MIPFSKEELKPIGVYPNVECDVNYMPGYEVKKLNTPITPRENWRRFFRGEDPLWVPDSTYDINFLAPPICPDVVAQSYQGGMDALGVKWIPDESCPDLPAFVEPGFIRLDDIEDYESLDWPDVDSWDWAAMKEAYSVCDPDRPSWYFLQSGLFERMINTLGFENAAVAFLEDPESAHGFLDRTMEYDMALMEHVRTYLNADLIVFSDDWGAQKAPFFSNAVAEEFLVPRMEKLVKRCHELGMTFMHHCCGNVRAFLPYMIDEGVDSWQFNYGAVKTYLHDVMAQYGDRMKFDGYFNMLNVFPQDEKIFKEGSEAYYREWGKSGVCSITVYDYYYDWDVDTRSFLYETARRTYAD